MTQHQWPAGEQRPHRWLRWLADAGSAAGVAEAMRSLARKRAQAFLACDCTYGARQCAEICWRRDDRAVCIGLSD